MSSPVISLSVKCPSPVTFCVLYSKKQITIYVVLSAREQGAKEKEDESVEGGVEDSQKYVMTLRELNCRVTGKSRASLR